MTERPGFVTAYADAAATVADVVADVVAAGTTDAAAVLERGRGSASCERAGRLRHHPVGHPVDH